MHCLSRHYLGSSATIDLCRFDQAESTDNIAMTWHKHHSICFVCEFWPSSPCLSLGDWLGQIALTPPPQSQQQSNTRENSSNPYAYTDTTQPSDSLALC